MSGVFKIERSGVKIHIYEGEWYCDWQPLPEEERRRLRDFLTDTLDHPRWERAPRRLWLEVFGTAAMCIASLIVVYWFAVFLFFTAVK